MLKLTPKIHPLIHEFIQDKTSLVSLLKEVGSPCNIIFPDILAENISEFETILQRLAIPYTIYYAHKANQAKSLVRQALRDKLYIDVASLYELENAFTCGFKPEQIEATGPKSEAYIQRLIKEKILINVDNEWELEKIIELAQTSTKPYKQPILLRFTGFSSSSYGLVSKVSRFGIPIQDADQILKLVQAYTNTIDFVGFAFHLDTNEVKEKVLAIDNLLTLFEKAYSLELSPRVINIGGGFRQVFIEDKDGWEEYVQALKDALSGKRESLSWMGNTFGYRQEKGMTQGIPIFHKYGDTTPGYSYLNQLLTSPLLDHEGRTVATVLKENMIDLSIEPGKALVDHTGITVTTVEFVKKSSEGDILVNLDIKRDNIVPVDQEVMIDPVVIYQGKDDTYKKGDYGVYFAGNLCLERDMIYTHKTFLEKLPQPGDLVIFINTGAYQMDLSASDALMKPRPQKVAVAKKGKVFKWWLDDDYQTEVQHGL